MTHRYDLLLESITATNTMIFNMFLFALGLVIAYRALEWTPAWMRRPAQALYLASVLVMFLYVTVYSA